MSEFTDENGLVLKYDAAVQKGTRYKWCWYGYGDEVVEQGEITAANGKDLVEFSFAGTMKVQVTIKREEQENIVEL